MARAPRQLELASKANKAEAICAEFRRNILEGRLPRGAALPTQVELGRRFGVAPATAGMAMARLAQERLIVRTRRRGTFVSETLPRAASSVHIFRTTEAPNRLPRLFELHLLDLIAHALSERRSRGLWHHLPLSEANDIEGLLERLGDARRAIFVRFPTATVDALRQRGAAVVSVSPRSETRPVPPAAFPQIDVDRAALARRAVEHLVGLGHRRIAYVSRGATAEWTRGFLQAVRDFDLPTPAAWVIEGQDYFLSDSADRIRSVLRARVRPTAVCCSLVYVAAIVESLALGLGRRVPQDLAVVAADAAPDAGQALVPVTTVGPSAEEMAEAALGQLEVAARSARRRDELLEPVILPPRLTVRASCGARPAETAGVTN